MKIVGYKPAPGWVHDEVHKAIMRSGREIAQYMAPEALDEFELLCRRFASDTISLLEVEGRYIDVGTALGKAADNALGDIRDLPTP